MFEHGLEHGAHAAGIGLISGSVNLLDADVVPPWWMGHDRGALDSKVASTRENELCSTSIALPTPRWKGSRRITSCFDIDLSDSPERVSWSLVRPIRALWPLYEHGPLSVMLFHSESSDGLPAPQELKDKPRQ